MWHIVCKPVAVARGGAHPEARSSLLLNGMHDRQRRHILHKGQAHACKPMHQLFLHDMLSQNARLKFAQGMHA